MQLDALNPKPSRVQLDAHLHHLKPSYSRPGGVSGKGLAPQDGTAARSSSQRRGAGRQRRHSGSEDGHGGQEDAAYAAMAPYGGKLFIPEP